MPISPSLRTAITGNSRGTGEAISPRARRERLSHSQLALEI